MKNMKILLALGMTGSLMVAIGVAQTRPAADLYQEALHMQEVKGDLGKAIEIYRTIVDRYPTDQAIAPKALLELAGNYERLGKPEAADVYRRIVREHAGSGAVAAAAQARLAATTQKDSGPVARQLKDSALEYVSPDGRYGSSTDENGNLIVRDLTSGRTRLLTNCGTKDNCWLDMVAFSADSRFLAYGWWSQGEGGLRVISRDGGQPRVIYSDVENGEQIEPWGWAPDGASILAAKEGKGGTLDLMLIPASGGAARTVKHFDNVAATRFSMSPDGRSVAYDVPAAPGKPERDLFSLSLDTGRDVRMLTHPADDYVLGWFPEGPPRILFGSDRTGTYGIWATRVVDGLAQGEPMLVRPDTGHVAGTLTRKGDFYYTTYERLDEMFLATLDPTTGKQTGRLTRFEGRFTDGSVAPAWSPDGDRMLYVQRQPAGRAALTDPRGSNSPNNKDIAIQTVSTGDVRLLSPGPGRADFGKPSWLPDGSAVIVNAGPGADRGLFKVNIETGALTNIRPAGQLPASSHPNAREPMVSPDGRRVFFNPGPAVSPPGSSPGQGIFVRDLTSGVEQAVSTRPVERFALSPDGQWLAEIERIGESLRVFVIPSSGGEPRPVAAVVSGWDIEANLSWSHDSRFLFVSKLGPRTEGPRSLEIWQVPADGSAPRNTGINWSASSGISNVAISAHPDGRRLAIGTNHRSSTTWVLQNLTAQAK